MKDQVWAHNKLPKMKLSELIDMGLQDVERAENTPGVFLNMDFWHAAGAVRYGRGGMMSRQHADRTETCAVCFAGATMMQRLDVPNDHGDDIKELLYVGEFNEITPDNFDDKVTRQQLFAMNELREGDVIDAIDCLLETHPELGRPDPEGSASIVPIELPEPFIAKRYWGITEYGDSPGQFKLDMRGLSAALKAIGL